MIPQIMPITDLRRDTRAVLHAIQSDGRVVYITQHGRPAAVMLDYRQYEALVADHDNSINRSSSSKLPTSHKIGVSGQSLQQFAGTIPADDIALMQVAIAADCEQVDLDE